MVYIPHTRDDIREMLKKIGKESLLDLFKHIPEDLRRTPPLDLPPALSEGALIKEMESIAKKNMPKNRVLHFLGGGAYDHIVPASVGHLLSRSEFYSAYTPYQPEISQGILQAMFEFQTMICQLAGMEVANASMYDGASSTAEAVLMALRITKKKRVLISEALHPEYQQVVETYCQHTQAKLEKIPVGNTGETDVDERVLAGQTEDTACMVIQSPNFFGCLEPARKLRKRYLKKGGLLVHVVTEPLSLGILASPGAQGADAVVGEFQSFGIPLQYGGPFCGFFSTRKSFMRHMPGRVVGQTVDLDGRRGFVLTLSTREQHIRRNKATSNICTNHSLCALACTIHLALLGKNGLREVARMNLSKAEYAKERIREIQGIRIPFSSPTFNEFVIELPCPASAVLDAINRENNILAGITLEKHHPGLENHFLVCVTEKRTRKEIDQLVEALKKQCQKSPTSKT